MLDLPPHVHFKFHDQRKWIRLGTGFVHTSIWLRRLGPAKIIISEDNDDDDRLIELCFPPCSPRNLSSDVGGDGAAA